MKNLFDAVQAGDLALANRIVMAPLTRNRAPGAQPNALMVEYYRQRAGAGLIITEATAISHQGQGYADVPGLWSSDQVAGWRRVTDAVHAAGGRIVPQLWHVGRISHPALQPDGQAPVAPSALQAQSRSYLIERDASGQVVSAGFEPTAMPRALDISELPGIVSDYVRAARNAIDAGFDGIEIHAANGYLLDQFLRSGSNQRTDAYGGSIENRARLLIEVMQAVTQAIGAGRVGVRLSPVSPANDAMDADPQPLFNHVMTALAPLGLAYIHVVEGATAGPRDHSQGETPFDWAALQQAYRSAGGQGAWMVNNGYTRELADEALAGRLSGAQADLVAFGRPYIANPDLAERLRTGAPLNPLDADTLYGGGAKGYTDYPALDSAPAA
ncbi:alkene reductase [Amphibiibacter pelophylacis]|uniref:Alkene reductase n=1 Tax=Amphibiibacter pelophylacis TaxID=1799477 RepID=A0ACC6NZS6_9BURK